MSAPGAAARPAAGRPAGDKPTAEGAGIAVAATKDRHGENFPVASRLIAPERRGAVAAFYAFARTADDIADHPDLAPADKLRRLDRLAAGLMPGAAGAPAVAADLAVALAAHGLGAGHALALLGAFRAGAMRAGPS